jgi:hypothetical protein
MYVWVQDRFCGRPGGVSTPGVLIYDGQRRPGREDPVCQIGFMTRDRLCSRRVQGRSGRTPPRDPRHRSCTVQLVTRGQTRPCWCLYCTKLRYKTHATQQVCCQYRRTCRGGGRWHKLIAAMVPEAFSFDPCTKQLTQDPSPVTRTRECVSEKGTEQDDSGRC